MTREQYNISQKNRRKAAKYFNLQKGYCMHHKDTSLKHENIKRYIQWNPEDLVVLTKEEHCALHHKGDNHHGEKNPMYGKKSPLRKTVYQIDVNTKELIATFESMTDASEYTGIKRESISMACNGKQKTAGGYIWKFEL